jgi:hypothetical protein
MKKYISALVPLILLFTAYAAFSQPANQIDEPPFSDQLKIEIIHCDT